MWFFKNFQASQAGALFEKKIFQRLERITDKSKQTNLFQNSGHILEEKSFRNEREKTKNQNRKRKPFLVKDTKTLLDAPAIYRTKNS